MNIKKKLKIVNILFSDNDEVDDETVDSVMDSLHQKQIKRATYKKRMIDRYGEDVFSKRAKKAVEARESRKYE